MINIKVISLCFLSLLIPFSLVSVQIKNKTGIGSLEVIQSKLEILFNNGSIGYILLSFIVSFILILMLIPATKFNKWAWISKKLYLLIFISLITNAVLQLYCYLILF